MNDHAVEWARSKGRSSPGSSSKSRTRQLAARWCGRAIGREVAGPTPPPEESVGRRLPPDQRLRAAATVDADAAWTFLVTERSRPSRPRPDLVGWRWRKASRQDLESAVAAHTFFQSPGGWVIAEADEEDLGTVACSHSLGRSTALSGIARSVARSGRGSGRGHDPDHRLGVRGPATRGRLPGPPGSDLHQGSVTLRSYRTRWPSWPRPNHEHDGDLGGVKPLAHRVTSEQRGPSGRRGGMTVIPATQPP